MRQMGLRGATRGSAFAARRSQTSCWLDLRIWLSGTSPLTAPTSCGCRTSRTWPPGSGSSTWRSSSTCSPARSSGGEPRGRCGPICALDALEQAIWDRLDGDPTGLVHHSDRGSQYLSIRYTERLAEAGIEPSVGTVGDSYDNALAETIIGLYKTEVIRSRGPWTDLDDVEYATLEWVDWFNHRRILEPIGDIPPAEYEANYYRQNSPADTGWTQAKQSPINPDGFTHVQQVAAGQLVNQVR